MKPLRGLVVASLAAGTAWWAWNQGRMNYDEPDYYGYVEGEYIQVAAPVSGVLAGLDVARGDQIGPGTSLFKLDDTSLLADRGQAVAAVGKAKAQLADLEKGAREEEINIKLAELDEARAALKNSELELERQQALKGTNALVEAKLDQAEAARDQAVARVHALEASLALARLPARVDQLEAARKILVEAETRVTAVDRKLLEIAPMAPVAAMVQDTYYLPGAWVPANMPVISLLPDDKRKLRFYVPQGEIATLRIGAAVRFHCDGCGDGLTAEVSYIAPQAEYTPPVIYSAESREKLVFMVEASLEGQPLLPVGLPVEVDRADIPGQGK